MYYLWGALDKPRQVTKIYESYVPVSALALGGRTKKHESSYPGAKCQKNVPGSEQKNMVGNSTKKIWTGHAQSCFFDISVLVDAGLHQ